MTKMEPDGKSETQGICLKCARDMGIKPVDEIMGKFGISPDDIDFDSLDADIEELADSIGDDQTDEKSVEEKKDGELEPAEGRAPSLDIAKIFGSGIFPMGKMPSNGTKSDKKAGKSTEPKFKFLEQYCTNLNEKAKRGGIDRIVGRDRELDRVMQILCRRQKNNPCLIGEPGVGKTAVAEALSQKIADGNVPVKLLDKEVYLVDLTALVAGTQFRGQFESRMQGLLNDVKKKGNVILVIDEVHNIVGAGEADGSMNAANILKPALSRGEIQVIGATTMTEYRKHIEKDSALERRFQPVVINEPSIDDTIKIMLGIKHYYENYHGIKISDEIAEKSVHLSERYITDRFLPDKAIDLIDEAASYVVLNSEIISKYDLLLAEQQKIEKEYEKIENLIKENNDNSEEDYAKIAELKAKLMSVNNEIDAIYESRKTVELTLSDLADVIEIWTGIPASSINESEFKRIDGLENRLKGRIIGQDKAVASVVKAIKRNRAGVSYKRKPVSFIFAGPTGVGKTELVKTLAGDLFNSPEALIRLDMSEFMEKHSVSRIIGAPPGYVGYDDAGQLTEKIRRKPYSVVLFDEIEKAHPEVMNILLQILDDGRITDAHGKTVNFENTVLIMTTNAGSDSNSASAGFALTEYEINETKTEKALSRFLRPEFLNRVDEIITFNSLTKEDFVSIADIMLNDLKKALGEKNLKIVWNDDVIRFVANKSFSSKYGARNMRRFIQTEIEDKIADEIISKYDTGIFAISIDISDDNLVFAYA
jgi:ATP-dependent Clp protease ATP-binding subunit ClpA